MNNFCVLPWFGREINYDGKYDTHCCLLPQKYDIKRIQQDMLANKRPEECQRCWNLVDQGLTSDRQLKNAALDWYQDRDLQFIKKDAEQGMEKTLMLKLLTSYTCNATCVSCGSNNSSSWAKLDRKENPKLKIKKYQFIDLEKVYKEVDFSSLVTLTLLGGEPLYERKNFQVLEKLLELGNDRCFISMVTNGSVAISEDYKKILSKFKNLNFCVSIDGTGPVFEYLRYPLDWALLESNLKFFRKLTDLVSANYTLSNLNVLYHNETVTWFNNQKIEYANNPIYRPTWLQPRALPTHVKQHLKTVLNSVDYDMYIGDYHTNTDQSNFEEFLVQIKRQDQLKDISIKHYLPELCELIGLDLFK
jgi:sulfatase maturation enzyme AslB (radical SAM superfamily)